VLTTLGSYSKKQRITCTHTHTHTLSHAATLKSASQKPVTSSLFSTREGEKAKHSETRAITAFHSSSAGALTALHFGGGGRDEGRDEGRGEAGEKKRGKRGRCRGAQPTLVYRFIYIYNIYI